MAAAPVPTAMVITRLLQPRGYGWALATWWCATLATYEGGGPAAQLWRVRGGGGGAAWVGSAASGRLSGGAAERVRT